MGVPFDNRVALSAARRLTLEGTTARVVRAMNEAGVRCLLLKGPTISDLYDGVRQYSDVDLLIAPETARAAEGALTGLGFVLRDDDPHSRIWWRRGVDVDLHSTLVGVQAGSARLWEVLGAETEIQIVGDERVEVLSRPARALHVVLHAAQHGLQEPKPREDLRRALERVPAETWVAAARLAVALDAQAAFWTGLSMEPAGRELSSRLELEKSPTRTETELRAWTAPPTALGLLRLAETPGLGAKLQLIWREAFPSSAYVLTWSPLARRGWPGLVLARVWRPIWILIRLGPALAAIMRARRAARG
jgi:Uncharacterised nucleotidyltransferase